MVGEEDTAIVPARAEAIARAIPGARLVRIPRAGHMSPIDAPERVTAELRTFLELAGQPAWWVSVEQQIRAVVLVLLAPTRRERRSSSSASAHGEVT
jgi:hypothetical protein